MYKLILSGLLLFLLGCSSDRPTLGELLETHDQAFRSLHEGLPKVANELQHAFADSSLLPCGTDVRVNFAYDSPDYNADFINLFQLTDPMTQHIGPMGELDLSRNLIWAMRTYQDKLNQSEALKYPYYDEAGLVAATKVQYVLVPCQGQRLDYGGRERTRFVLASIDPPQALCAFDSWTECDPSLAYDAYASCHRLQLIDSAYAVVRQQLHAPLVARDQKRVRLKD